MPTPAFISIEGSNQGKITAGAFTEDSVGNVYVEGHEDEIMARLAISLLFQLIHNLVNHLVNAFTKHSNLLAL